MALYDIAAVLLPGGPLKLLLDEAIKKEEALPGLLYEARPSRGPYQVAWGCIDRQQASSQMPVGWFNALVCLWAPVLAFFGLLLLHFLF